jgi:hypothetical protein
VWVPQALGETEQFLQVFRVCNRSRVEGDSRTGMRKARVMLGAGTGRRMAGSGRSAASRPGLGIPPPISALKAGIIL